ncbi:MAG TPA: tetratricopeptide repeat protein [Nannocystaceae bacterium]|nr:tetratricopeptide repeat protein [Nannocystaceae bacterium]
MESGHSGRETLADPSASDGADVATTRVEPGTRVGRYEILAQLGEGGMGVVYVALDPELQRKVALKILRAGDASWTTTVGRSRLLREAQALAKLTHPNVVTIHDVGEHRGTVWIAMELVDGRTLHQWLVQARPRWAAVLDVFEQAGRGLAAAHAEGLVHRDFKPDNVMIAASGRVLVMDFGLARAQNDPATAEEPTPSTTVSSDLLSSPLTQAGGRVGTPAYMAPEQHLGLRTEPRTDQFSYCIALWEALYGVPPYMGDTLATLSMNVTDGVIREPPTQGLAGRVPTWLRRVCERGLQPRPADRWPTMDALLEAIARGRGRARRRVQLAALASVIAIPGAAWLYHRADVRARVDACTSAASSIDEVWNDDARARITRAFAATSADTAVKTIAWLDPWAESWRDTRAATCMHADVERTWDADLRARADDCLAERRLRLGALVDELGTGEPSVVLRAVAAASSLPGVAACGDRHELATWPVLPADARAAAGDVLRDESIAGARMLAGRYPEALADAERALASAEALAFPPLVADARRMVGVLRARLGDFAAAEAALAQAYRDAAISGAPRVAAEAAISLVHVVGSERAHHAEALVWAKTAEAVIVPLEPEPGLLTARWLDNLASVHFAMGAYAEARTLQEQSLAIREAKLAADHPEIATALVSLGATLRGAADYEGARALQQRAFEIRERAFGAEHPEVASSLSNLAVIDVAVGDYAAAIARLERARAILERALGPEHPEVADVLASLGTAHRAVGALDEAVPLFERVLAIRRKALPPEHPDIARALNNLATAWHVRNEPARERAALEEALRIWEQAMGPDHPEVAAVLVNLAKLEESEGHDAIARRHYERALAIRRAALGPDHPKLAYVLVGLANVALSEGRPADARAHAERAVELRSAGKAPATELAEARFVLARALAESGDRERGLALAQEVAATFRATQGMAGAASFVEGWIAQQRAKP